MHHTIAWRESVTGTAATDIEPVADELLSIQNGHFVPQVDQNLLFAYAGGAEINDARFISPSFRQITNPRIRPINLAIVPVDEPNMADYSENPLRIKGLEELQLEITHGNAGALVVVGVAGLSKVPVTPAPRGDIYTMRGTGTATAVAGAWTLIPITWADTLPTGTYACVGCEFVGATCIAGRLIFEEQWERSGGLGQSLVSGNGPELFRKGRLGVWGRFNANRMPNVQMLCNAADTAQTVFLDLIRVG